MDNSMANFYGQGMPWPNYVDYSAYAASAGTGVPVMYPGTMDYTQQQAQYYNYNYAAGAQQYNYQPTINQQVPPPPPPPPPPRKNDVSPLCSPTNSEPSLSPPDTSQQQQTIPPPPPQPYLACPPLPPTFPWVTSGMYAPFNETTISSSNESLPFVPVVLPEERLKSMTESVQNQVSSLQTKLPSNWAEKLIDPQLPNVLKEMFQPLYCKLCTLTLTSPVVAMDHYKGKRHKKRIEMWFEENEPAANRNHSAPAPPPNTMNNMKDQNGSYTAVPPPAQLTGGNPPPPRTVQRRNLSVDSQKRHQMPDRHQHGGGPESLLSGANAVPLGSSSWSSPPISQQPLPLMSMPVSAPFKRQPQKQSPSFTSAISGTVTRLPAPGPGGSFQSNNNINNKRPLMPDAGGGPPPLIKKDRKEPGKGGGGGNFGYCKFCDVTLSSQINADQHYAGKRHRESVAEARQTGNFDDNERNFGFGNNFRPNNQNPNTVESTNASTNNSK